MDYNKQGPHKGIDVNRDFFKNMKWVVRKLFDEDGQLLEVGQRQVSHFRQMKAMAPKQFELLCDILTYYLKEDTKTPVVKKWLLSGRNMSQGEFARQNNMKENTFYVHLRRDKTNFISMFGEWCLYELSDSNGSQSKSGKYLPQDRLLEYQRRLASRRNDIGRLQNNLLLDVMAFTKEDTPYMDSLEFNSLCNELWNKVSRPVVNELTDRCKKRGLFGYINHLMNTPDKSPKEWEDFRQIIRMIEGKEPTLKTNN